jgi:hypothetical protein
MNINNERTISLLLLLLMLFNVYPMPTLTNRTNVIYIYAGHLNETIFVIPKRGNTNIIKNKNILVNIIANMMPEMRLLDKYAKLPIIPKNT